MNNLDLAMFTLTQFVCLTEKEMCDVVITENAENDFTIDYHLEDPFDGFGYSVRITEQEDTYTFDVYESVYGDKRTVVYGKDLQYLYTLEEVEEITAADYKDYISSYIY